MISSLLVFLSAGCVSLVNAEPFIVEQASNAIVSYAAEHHAPDVPATKASEAASVLVSSALSPPQVTEFVQSAVVYVALHGLELPGSEAEKWASKASSFYDAIATKPAYKSYAQAFAQATPLFDVNAIVSDALAVEGKYQGTVDKAVSKASSLYASLESDAAGAQAIETGKLLASRVAKDFNITSPQVTSLFN